MWSSGHWNARTITTTARVITGKPNSQLDRKTAFKNVAYYNFIQTMMESRSRRPDFQEGQNSLPAFHATLSLLRPSHVVVGGYLQWEHLMNVFGPGKAVLVAGERVECCLFPSSGGEVLALRTEHMSRASADFWHPIFSAFINLIAADLA